MNLSKFKVVLVFLFSVNAMSSQSFAGEGVYQSIKRNLQITFAAIGILTTSTCTASSLCEEIKLDETSQDNLLAFAKKQANSDKYWPKDTYIVLENFCVIHPDKKEYHARFQGRYAEGFFKMRKDRSAFIPEKELGEIGVTLPEEIYLQKNESEEVRLGRLKSKVM